MRLHVYLFLRFMVFLFFVFCLCFCGDIDSARFRSVPSVADDTPVVGDDIGRGSGQGSGGNTPTLNPRLVERHETFVGRWVQTQDFLFVIDNSGSMEEEITEVIDNVHSFVQNLQRARQVDYRMAFISTDIITDRARPYRSQGGYQVIGPTTTANPLSEVQSILEIFLQTVRNPATWENTQYEMGLESMKLAIRNYGQIFLRERVPLAVITLSDENDSSCLWAPSQCSTNHYASYLANLNRSVLYFPVVGLPPIGSCASIYSLGTRYSEVQNILGTGRAYAMCQGSVVNSLNAIASEISTRGICYTLSGRPVDSSVKVSVDNTAVPNGNGFQYDASTRSVCFSGTTTPPEGAKIDITYDEPAP